MVPSCDSNLVVCFPIAHLHFTQVSRDVYKAFPVLAIFAVPIVGYLGPILGVLYPKVLLPAQFWTSSQRLEYMLQVTSRKFRWCLALGEWCDVAWCLLECHDLSMP